MLFLPALSGFYGISVFKASGSAVIVDALHRISGIGTCLFHRSSDLRIL